MATRKFTREFKLSAVRLVNEQGYTIAAAAQSLRVDPNSVRYWIGKYAKNGSAAPPSRDGAVQEELRRLREENARLLMERDVRRRDAAA